MGRYFCFTIFALLLLGCGEPDTKVVAPEKPIVVQLSAVEKNYQAKSFEFPATVEAVKDVNLKFELSGRLVMVNLSEGKRVIKGELLAKIDQAPFIRKVAESRIRLDLATTELNRMQTMFDKGVASKRMFDNAKSEFEIARLALANAEQDLSYTELRAPFDAVVSARFIDNNSYIKSSDTIATLQDVSSYYFTFDVPEKLITANAGNTQFDATATVLSNGSKTYDIHYVEHQTQPDPITQTYSVTFALNSAEKVNLIPGTRATVKVKKLHPEGEQYVVPLSALIGSGESGFHVWVFNPQSQRVAKQSVDVLTIENRHALIGPGLTVGQKVVSAAANKMRQGLLVKEYVAVK
ncbi:efflux RND transporter periplasmic adaptor subunit [Thalassotalea aquiviva]|uniref:efflux RND transporter periplasmic adaptor subunit n=1 Tax=Thalassotalea aquiviva TaxID=3242415 RepID=UPI00352A347D